MEQGTPISDFIDEELEKRFEAYRKQKHVYHCEAWRKMGEERSKKSLLEI